MYSTTALRTGCAEITYVLVIIYIGIILIATLCFFSGSRLQKYWYIRGGGTKLQSTVSYYCTYYFILASTPPLMYCKVSMQ